MSRDAVSGSFNPNPVITATMRAEPFTRPDAIRLRSPAIGAAHAGLRNLIASGRVDGSARIVAVMTGFGLKDPDTASRLVGEIREADATIGGVRAALGW